MKRLLVIAGLVVALLAAWFIQASFFLSSAERNVLLMDTFVAIRVTGKNAEVLASEAVAEMGRLEAIFTVHTDGSEIATINASFPEEITVSREVMEVLLLAQEIYTRSEGAFDVTVGALLRLWGFGTDDQTVPSAEDLSAAMEGVGLNNVIIDADASTVRMLNPATRLDLGGIAKGYIVDRAVQLLKKGGAKHVLVDAGGDVRVFGGRPGENQFAPPRAARVGVQDPRSPRSLVAIVSVMDGAVLTSGDYERFFIVDGIRYSHIMDPRTGYPAQGIVSVTVVAESAALADGIATAAMVLGREAGLNLINYWPGVEGMLITEDEEIVLSADMAAVTEIVRAAR